MLTAGVFFVIVSRHKLVCAALVALATVGACSRSPSSGSSEPVVVEVFAPRQTFLGKVVSRHIDDKIVRSIRAADHVVSAVPRRLLSYPARATWTFTRPGSTHTFAFELEVGGGCDGVPTRVMAGEPWAAEFADTGYAGRVPVAVSRHVLAAYNADFAPKHDLPALTAAQLRHKKFDIELGKSFLPNAPPTKLQRRVKAVVVGVSKHALPGGLTVPLKFAKHWYQQLSGTSTPVGYSSVLVTLSSRSAVADFDKWLRKKHRLRLRFGDNSK